MRAQAEVLRIERERREMLLREREQRARVSHRPREDNRDREPDKQRHYLREQEEKEFRERQNRHVEQMLQRQYGFEPPEAASRLTRSSRDSRDSYYKGRSRETRVPTPDRAVTPESRPLSSKRPSRSAGMSVPGDRDSYGSKRRSKSKSRSRSRSRGRDSKRRRR